jgi:hypothetical protein
MTEEFTSKPLTKVLIYGGKTGWIGGLMYKMCVEKGKCVPKYQIERKGRRKTRINNDFKVRCRKR